MSSDLTAMRWQLIRTIEADQLLEQENIELRQKLKSCEEQLGQVTVAHREACAKIAIGMERTVSQLRSDIGDTRSQYFVEMDLMKQGFKEVAGQLGQMSRKNKELRQQSEALAVANARLQNDLEKSCSHSDKKTGHLSDELSRVKKELIDACAQHTHALSIIDAKDQAIRNKEADIDELNKQLKSSQQNIGRLNRTIKQLELHGSSEIEDIKKKSLDAEAMYNEKINSMEIEIGQLKSDIVGYKDEISRLSVKQAPKKTPFTQYVDLKNQNENLKAKVVDLKNIVRSVDPKQKSKVGHLVGMTAVDSVDNMIANCANVAKSQPTSPRMNNIRTASSHVPDVVNKTHHLDGMSDNLMELSVPSLNPHPPARAITGTSILSAKTIIKIPSSQKGNTQRPSQYRTGARPKVVLNEKVMRSSTSENPARPQSGRSKTSRAPSPIVM